MRTFIAMIFVTGGTGLVGSHLLMDLCRKSDPIRAMKRATSNLERVRKLFAHYGFSQADFERIEWVDVDMLDRPALDDAMAGCTHVYHAAALVSFESKDARKVIHLNITGTANLVNAALEARVKKFCHVSSTAAIGVGPPAVPLTEESKWKTDKTTTKYALSKHYSEREVWRGSEEGLDVVVVNPCVIIGPGNWENSSPVIFKTVYEGFPFYTMGGNSFVDARDVSRAMVELMDSDIVQERFLVIGENLPYQDFFKLVAKSLGKPPPSRKATRLMTGVAWRADWLRYKLTGKTPRVTRESARSSHQIRYFSNEKIKKALGFEFRPIEQAVQETATYFLQDYPKQRGK